MHVKFVVVVVFSLERRRRLRFYLASLASCPLKDKLDANANRPTLQISKVTDTTKTTPRPETRPLPREEHTAAATLTCLLAVSGGSGGQVSPTLGHGGPQERPGELSESRHFPF